MGSPVSDVSNMGKPETVTFDSARDTYTTCDPDSPDSASDSASDRQISPSSELQEYEIASRSTSKSSRVLNNEARPRYDMLTLRQWFNHIDQDGNGHIGRAEWFTFLRMNPVLKKLILWGDASLHEDMSEKEKCKAEVSEIRRLLRLWKLIDTDKNGTLEWEEFVEFFRSTGYLLEYGNKENPRDLLLSTLVEMQDSDVDELTLQEFEMLTRMHTGGERRKSLETEVLYHLDGGNPLADRLSRRQSMLDAGDPLCSGMSRRLSVP